MQPNVTKQVKPALQQTASPALQQQIEPKELKAPKRLHQHKLLHLKNFWVLFCSKLNTRL